jgi:hypothetical protein
LIDPDGWSRAASRRFSLPLRLAASRDPLPLDRLSPGERAVLERLGSERRRESWRRGRAALRAIGVEDGAALVWPHPERSLTHSGSWAVAAALPPGAAAGLGVDLELDRTPSEGTERKFLVEGERAWIGTLPVEGRSAARRRLWTLKEAAFKADPGNRGLILADYRIPDPAAGLRARREGGPEFECLSVEWPGGCLSLALLRSVAPPAAAK